MEAQIPAEIAFVTQALRNGGFEAYLVGGCVRDLLRGHTPKDWDVTTNATPDEIQACFPHSFYENNYGTVGLVNEEASDPSLRIIEVTPYRIEGGYADNRRPTEVQFSNHLKDDLGRRDFTMNAIAYNEQEDELVDPYKGQKDIKDNIIRTVGNPAERFAEDYLRMLRAVRLAAELDFSVSHETYTAIQASAQKLENASVERIREEFSRIITSPQPYKGIVVLHETGLLPYIIPELEEGIGIEQRGEHIYDVWEHNLRALDHAAKNDWPFHVKLAALLHDVGKPRTREWSKEQNQWTFHGHDVVGAKMTRAILNRLKFPKETTKVVSKLVRYHLFFSDIEKITLSAVRRLIRNVGQDHIWDLMNVRRCDRIATGRPKEKPYRLRKFESMIDEALRDPITVNMLKIDGGRIMEVTHETPGPRIGYILHALLEEVLDDAERNTSEYLESRARELAQLPDESLKERGKRGKQKQEKEEEQAVEKIRRQHHVK